MARIVLASLIALGTAHALTQTASAGGREAGVDVTWYGATGNPTASGQWPYEGSAGCSADIPLGSVIALPDGETVTCNDRGADGFLAPHADVYCDEGYAACQAQYGGMGRGAEVICWGGRRYGGC